MIKSDLNHSNVRVKKELPPSVIEKQDSLLRRTGRTGTSQSSRNSNYATNTHTSSSVTDSITQVEQIEQRKKNQAYAIKKDSIKKAQFVSDSLKKMNEEKLKLDALKKKADSLETALKSKKSKSPENSQKKNEKVPDSTIIGNKLKLPSDTLEKEDPIPESDISEPVKFKAEKQLRYDVKSEIMTFKKGVSIGYKGLEIQSDSLSYEPNNSIVSAFSLINKKNNTVEIPVKMKTTQGAATKEDEYTAEKIAYNIETKQGRVAEIKTKISKEKTSILSDALGGGEKKAGKNNIYGKISKVFEDEYAYVQDGFYSSCDLPHPHYYFYSPQMRVEADKEIVARPVILFVQDIPVLPLPFLYFPLTKDNRSGLIFPEKNGYGISIDQGLFINGIGYYWAINDSMDLEMTGDIGTRLSWKLQSRYRLTLGSQNTLEYLALTLAIEGGQTYINSIGDHDLRKTDHWGVNFTYHQKFDPTFSINANLNFRGGGTYTSTTYNATNILRKDISSGINISKQLSETQTFTIGATRVQPVDKLDGQNTFSISYTQAGELFPFKTKRGTNGIWEKFGIGISALNVNGSLNHTDSTITWSGTVNTGYSLKFRPIKDDEQRIEQDYLKGIAKKDRYGFEFPASFGISANLFRYLNFNTSFNLRSTLTDQETIQSYDAASKRVVSNVVTAPQIFQTFDVSTSLSTTFYGVLQTAFLEGIGLKGFLHKVNPSITYSYSPDFQAENFGYYRTYLDQNKNPVKYNRFQTSLYGSGLSGERQQFTFNVGNTFEMKVIYGDSVNVGGKKSFTKKEENIQLISANLAMSYNLAATQFKMSNLTIGGNISALNGVKALKDISLSLNYGMTLNPYGYNNAGKTIDSFLVTQRGQLFRLTSFESSLSATFRGGQNTNEPQPNQPRKNDSTFYNNPFLLSDLQSLNYKPNYSRTWSISISGRISLVEKTPLEPLEIQASVQGTFSFVLTKSWTLNFSLGYDFKTNTITYPTLNLGRNFHCWDMSLVWVPLGPTQGVKFSVGFTADELSAIRYTRTGSDGSLSSPIDKYKTP
ncbi:hypothetical protein CHS0354_000571 [Potamilus streckersoni]|uniref:LPS-assembly protein LptD central domain-containing protein n=1 Tax=Potamilus streckersoni TaxID=2493646 RepID=A0AAE0T7K8_9BIVA|nr:hypothetical protein CHS0354_000571 [Potamilus streckersoni]